LLRGQGDLPTSRFVARRQRASLVSINPDFRVPDYGRPASEVSFDPGAEFRRRPRDRLHQLRGELVADVGRREDLGNLAGNPCHDGVRRAGRRDDAVPGVGLDIDAALAERRNARQQRRARGGRDGENLGGAQETR
jgi:hypothetical protein